MRREDVHELLDDDLGTPGEIASALIDLRHINGWFGGTRTARHLLHRVADEAGSQELSLLEVGAGAGDVPRAVQRDLASENINLRITLLDRVASHLPRNGTPCVAGDALQLPFRDSAFDIVNCSLLAHHFAPECLVQFARESLRVCKRAVLMNDLVRSRLHLALVYAGLPLFRSRLTWHDAPASVRRAYTRSEMREMIKEVPARKVEISTHYLYRMGVTLWK